MLGPNTAGRTAPDPAGQVTKSQLRTSARERRVARDQTGRDEAAQQLTRRVLDLASGRVPRGSVIACYLSRPDEPDTHYLVRALLEAGYRVLAPSMHGGPAAEDIGWAWLADPTEVTAGVLGIERPVGETLPAPALAEAAVVILPGLAGGRDGSRLGMGAGWYDRALEHVKSGTLLWLLLFDDEIVDSLPQETHDHPVGVIITPRRTIVTADNGQRPSR